MTTSLVAKYVPWYWIADLAIFLVWNIAFAAPPPRPETATEIERALSVPETTQPGLKIRGVPKPDAPKVGHSRGPAAIVDDPTEFLQTIDSEDYAALINNRLRTAASIHFDTNSARIRAEAHRLLTEYVGALKSPALADAVFVIAGHTDAVGSEQYNLKLSRWRAQAVKDHLVERGIASNRLIVRGYGEAYPVASNGTAAGRELNRRCEFIRMDVRATFSN